MNKKKKKRKKEKKKKKTFNKLCKEALSRSNRSPVNKSKKYLHDAQKNFTYLRYH